MEAPKKSDEHAAVDSYIQEIVELAIPANVLINNVVLSDCRLVYREENKKKLFIRTFPGDYPETGEVSIACVYSNKLYTFKSRIVSQKETDAKFAYLEIRIPDKIAKEERRKHLRIKPSDENPVQIRFSLADNSIISIEIMDISGGGLSFVVPANISEFQIGDSFSLNITMPRYGEIQTSAVIKTASSLLNMMRIGVEFADISEHDYRMVILYVTGREMELKKELEKMPPLKKPKVYLIDHSRQDYSYELLDNTFDVVRTDFFNVISKLAANPPELITINKDRNESWMLLQLIVKHRILKHIPLILLSQEEREEEQERDKTFENKAILSFPLNERLFVRTAEGFIDKYRLVKRHSEKKIKMLSGQLKKALIIDRFKIFSTENNQILTKYGFQVNISDNEDNIMKRIESDYPDIILFDEETEKVDPVSICRLVNINKRIKAIPKIIMTSDERNFDNFYSQGLFAGFLIKPVNPSQLISKVLDILLQRAGE